MPSLAMAVLPEPRKRRALVLFGGALVLLAGIFLARGNDARQYHAQGPRLSPSVFLRIGGLRKTGITPSARWYAQAEDARTVAQKLGFFRFAPIRVQELTGLRVTIELLPESLTATEAVMETLASVPTGFGDVTQPAGLTAYDVRLLVVNSDKEPLALLLADSATWSGGDRGIRLNNVVWRERRKADLSSRTAQLDPTRWHLAADSWVEFGAPICSTLGILS